MWGFIQIEALASVEALAMWSERIPYSARTEIFRRGRDTAHWTAPFLK